MYPKLFLVMRGNFHFRWILAILLGQSLDSIYETPFNRASINVLESLNRIVESCTEFWQSLTFPVSSVLGGVRSMSVDWEVPWNSHYICAKIRGEQLSSKINAWKSQFSDYVATEMERVNRDLLAAWNETNSVTLTFVFCKGRYIWAYRNNRQERGCLTGSETGAM